MGNLMLRAKKKNDQNVDSLFLKAKQKTAWVQAVSCFWGRARTRQAGVSGAPDVVPGGCDKMAMVMRDTHTSWPASFVISMAHTCVVRPR